MSALQRGIHRLRAFGMTKITLVAMTLMLLAGALVPIYIDELLYRIMQERLFFEGGNLITLYPQCPRSFSAPVPLALMPGAGLLSLFYAPQGLLDMRLGGVAFAFFWFALLWVWLAPLRLTGPNRLLLYGLIVAIQLLGVLPFLLVLARPEQLMVLCIAFFVLAPLRLPANAALSFFYFLAISLFFFLHPTAAYFLPLVMVSVFFALRKRGWLMPLALGAFALVAGFQAYGNFTRVLPQCSEVPQLVHFFDKATLPLSLLASDPVQFTGFALRNISQAIPALTQHIHLAASYQSNWLPPSALPFLGALFLPVNGIISIVWIGLTLVSIAALLFYPRRKISYCLAWALALAIMANAAHFNRFHFTSVSLIMPCLVMLLLLSADDILSRAIEWRWARRGLTCLIVIALFSAGLAIITLGPNLVRNAVLYQPTLSNQHNSYQTFLAGEKHRAIKSLAGECGIEDTAHDLVVDDTSYPAFKSAPRPMFATYVNPNFMGFALKGRMREFLLERGSSGIIGKCDYLPPELNDIALRKDGLCCVNREMLKRRP